MSIVNQSTLYNSPTALAAQIIAAAQQKVVRRDAAASRAKERQKLKAKVKRENHNEKNLRS
jgi:hypothetical protein